MYKLNQLFHSLPIHKFLFYALILSIPIQLGKHFWPDFAFINGIRIDYLAPTVYLTDILIGLMLLSWLTSRLSITKDQVLSGIMLFFVVGLFVEANIFFSLSPYVAIFRWIKYLEMWLLVVYISKAHLSIQKVTKLLILAGLFTVFLALIQLINDGSIGGLFYFLGERSFTLSTPGISKQILFGKEYILPYATFSHPNVLAGYFVVTLSFILNGKWLGKNLKLFLVGLWLLIIYISGSAIAIIVGIGILFQYIKIRSLYKYLAFGAIVFIMGILSITYGTESVSRRVELNNIAYELFKSSPIVGIGMNNFVVQMSNYRDVNEPGFFFQPAHNIYLLLLSEGGIIGVGLLAWLIWKIYMIGLKRGVYIIPLVAILVLGLFDHYPLTLQQGQLLLAMVIGLNLRSTTGG